MKKRFLQIVPAAITTAIILFNCLTPVSAQSGWTTQVCGEVKNSLSLTLDQLAALPSTSVQADLYCDASYVIGGNWTGVTLGYLFEQAEVNSQGAFVGFTATDGYSVKITLATAMRDDVIVAYQLNGQPLSESVRLVIPGANGADWIAMINQIAVLAANNDDDVEPFQDSNPNQPTSAIPMPSQTTNAQKSAPESPTSSSGNQTTKQPAASSTEGQLQNRGDSSTRGIGELNALPLSVTSVVAVSAIIIIGYMVRRHRFKKSKTEPSILKKSGGELNPPTEVEIQTSFL